MARKRRPRYPELRQLPIVELRARAAFFGCEAAKIKDGKWTYNVPGESIVKIGITHAKTRWTRSERSALIFSLTWTYQYVLKKEPSYAKRRRT